MKTTSLFIPLLTAAYVSAHGFMRTVAINGQDYTGPVPVVVNSAPANSSIIRQVNTYFPIKGATNPGLTCGANSTSASQVANANPGDSLAFSWKAYDLSNWFHNAGPMLTYMANCGSTSCDQFDITNAKWFKIQQIAQNPNGPGWAQAELNTGGVATATMPATIAPGNYLMRHEIIALQNGGSVGGAEFYPACAQVKVGGTQTGAPTPDELVSLPGAYSDTDPGIYDPNVYNPGAPYTFPGPPIAAFVGGTTGGTASSGNSTTTNTTTAGSAPPVQTSSSSNSTATTATTATTAGSAPSTLTTVMTCIIASSPTTTSPMVARDRPRHLSRIMRRLSFW